LKRSLAKESPSRGAKLDERRKKLSYQRVLSSHIRLFCPSALSSEVLTSKVAVFCGLQSAGVKLFHLEGGNHIKLEKNEHSMELYVLGDIDKFDELEGLKDPEFGDNHWQTWVDLSKLESLDVRPKKLVKLIIEDCKSNFSGETKYLGEVD